LCLKVWKEETTWRGLGVKGMIILKHREEIVVWTELIWRLLRVRYCADCQHEPPFQVWVINRPKHKSAYIAEIKDGIEFYHHVA
jgi:hypothetical protein